MIQLTILKKANIRRIVFFTLVFIQLILTGCSSLAARDYKFKEGAQEGFLIFGSQGPKSGYTLSLGSYDAETNSKTNTFKSVASFSHGGYFEDANNVKYFGAALKAGHYFISQISTQGYQSKYIYPKRIGAMTFYVKPGETVYLGEFSVGQFGKLKYISHDKEKAEDFISTYINLSNNFEVIKPSQKNIKNP